MRQSKYPTPSSVIEPNYFSNWGDLWYPKTANLLLEAASKITGLTPNIVTLASFALYALAAAAIVMGGNIAFAAVFALPVSYILDCLDGQLARYTGQMSAIGDYLDKTLDVLKIGIINLAMAIAAYNLTDDRIYFILGFVSCFGFLFRYYIKLETIFGAVNRDKDYLESSSIRRHNLYQILDARRVSSKSLKQRVEWLWFRHHSVMALDEAEHVTFAALAIAFSRPDIWCWVFGIGQIVIALVRLVERGQQLSSNPSSLTYPLRK